MARLAALHLDRPRLLHHPVGAARLHRSGDLRSRMQIVVTGAILITIYIGFLSSRAIGAEGGFRRNVASGAGLRPSPTSTTTTLDQFGLVVSLAINLMILLVFLPLILFMWGFQPGDIQAWAYRIADGLQHRLVHVLADRHPHRHRRLRHRLFPHALVPGAGWTARSWRAAASTPACATRSARSSAMPASGAGRADRHLGGGHRPLQPRADCRRPLARHRFRPAERRVELRLGPDPARRAAVQGRRLDRRRQRLGHGQEDQRARDRDRDVPAPDVILPNSELINSAVGNWTHRNKLGRVDIKVGVAYGTDVQARARTAARDRAKPSAGAEEPGAFRAFRQFRAGGAGVRDPRLPGRRAQRQRPCRTTSASSILETFEAEGIEIPSAPRAEHPKREDRWPTTTSGTKQD